MVGRTDIRPAAAKFEVVREPRGGFKSTASAAIRSFKQWSQELRRTAHEPVKDRRDLPHVRVETDLLPTGR